MIVISDAMVRQHVRFASVFAAIEKAFVSLDRGESAVFDVVRGTGTDPAHFFAIKSGRDGSIPAIGLKAGSYNPANLARGAAAHTSSTLLIDDTTGEPFALVEANYLNGMRTAAANGLATRELARADAAVLGVIGWGAQAVFEVEAVAHVRPIARVLAAGRSRASGARFAEQVQRRCGLHVELASAEAVARAADILVTVTPSTSPVIETDWVRPGTHISAMGADNAGKQELPVDLVSAANLYVDHADQAVVIGEAQHAARAGIVDRDGLIDRTLGALLSGRAAGRGGADEITVFDSSGIAIQDIAAAHAAIGAIEQAMKGSIVQIAS